jgi:membrane associated rhomboid family serine protease
MFFPLSDDDRELVRPAYVTWLLFALNVALFGWQVAHPDFTAGYAAVPLEITSGDDLVGEFPLEVGGGELVVIPHGPGPVPIYLTLFTAMFMHAGLMHLGGNLLFLWIFGDNVEHRFGSVKFLVFYLVSGLVASFAQIATDPSGVVPTLGASGAISGVLGAYLVLFPHNRVNALFFFRIVTVPAFLVLVMWAVMQVIGGFGARAMLGGGVAYAAHLGGFAAGVVLALVARLAMRSEPDSVLARAYRRDPADRRLW